MMKHQKPSRYKVPSPPRGLYREFLRFSPILSACRCINQSVLTTDSDCLADLLKCWHTDWLTRFTPLILISSKPLLTISYEFHISQMVSIAPAPKAHKPGKTAHFYGFFTTWKLPSESGGVAKGVAIFGIGKNGGHFRRAKRRWEGGYESWVLSRELSVLGAESWVLSQGCKIAWLWVATMGSRMPVGFLLITYYPKPTTNNQLK